MRWQIIARHSAHLNLTLQLQRQLRVCPQTQRLHINRSLQTPYNFPHQQQLCNKTRGTRPFQYVRPLCSKSAEVTAGKRGDKETQKEGSQDVWPFPANSMSIPTHDQKLKILS